MKSYSKIEVVSNQLGVFDNTTPIDPNIVYSPTASDQEIANQLDLIQAARAVAVDIETFGEKDGDGLDPWKGHIRTIQLGVRTPEGVRVFIADLGGWTDDREVMAARLERLGFFRVLKTLIESDTQWKIFQDGKFDLGWLYYKYGYLAQRCADTMLLSQLYWAGVLQYKHNLGAICERFGIQIDKTLQKSDFGFALTNEQLNYAARDVAVLFPLWVELSKRLVADGIGVSMAAEMNVMPAIAKMNIDGIPVDGGLLAETIRQYETAATEIEEPFVAKFPGLSIDDKSELPKKLTKLLGWTIRSTDKSTLNPHRDHPVVSSLLATRSIRTYLNYLYSIRDALRDGHVRGGFKQMADKGRGRTTSGSDTGEANKSKGKKKGIPSINLQNPPNPTKQCEEIAAYNLPPIRAVFRARPGYKFCVVDMSGAHARISAQMTGDRLYQQSYRDGLDVHAKVAAFGATLVKLDWTENDVTTYRKDKTSELGKLATQLRNCSKNIFYGWLNGAQAAKIDSTWNAGGFPSYFEFGRQTIELLKRLYPDIHKFHERIKRRLKTVKHRFPGVNLAYTDVRSLTGRRVYLPIWPKDPNNEKSYGGANPTDAVMSCWMMAEVDIVKGGLYLVYAHAIKHPEWDLRIVNVPHDEIVVEVKEEFAVAAAKVLWDSLHTCYAAFVTDIPVTESPFDPAKVICDSWDEK